MERDAELRQLVMQYEGTPVTPEEWNKARARADRKLAWIVSLYGDDNGQRKSPHYLAQLIAEAVRAERLSRLTRLRYELNEAERPPAPKHERPFQMKQPHYSTEFLEMQ